MKEKFKNSYQTLLGLDSDNKKKISKELKQQRGRDFEKLICDILENEGILLRRSYHTSDNKSEQIDAAIEIDKRVFLVEVKWVNSNLAASDLFSFIGKVENKLQGTLGLYISKKKLSDNFINSLNRGRRLSIIVLHGEDIDEIFNGNIRIKEYLTYCYKLMSYDNVSYFPVKEFIKIQKSTDTISDEVTPSKSTSEAALFIKENFLNSSVPEADILFLLEAKGSEVKDDVYQLVIKNYSQIFYYSLKRNNFSTIEKFDFFLRSYDPSQDIFKQIVLLYYTKLIFKDSVYANQIFIEQFSNAYKEINEETKKSIEFKLVDNFGQSMGNYNAENDLTEIIRPIWFDLLNKDKFIPYYLDIFISDRQSNYPQKAFANYLLHSHKIGSKEIEKWLHAKLEESVESYDRLTDSRILTIASTYLPVSKFMSKTPEKWKDYIQQKINRIKSKS